MMARYFLHLRDGEDVVIDEEGGEFATSEDLRRAMLATARDIIAGDVVRGVLNLDLSIIAQTVTGDLVDRLTFRDAVSFEHGNPECT